MSFQPSNRFHIMLVLSFRLLGCHQTQFWRKWDLCLIPCSISLQLNFYTTCFSFQFRSSVVRKRKEGERKDMCHEAVHHENLICPFGNTNKDLWNIQLFRTISVLYPYFIQPFRTLPSKMEVAPPEAISREYNIADCTYSKNTAGSVIVILAACSVSLSDQKPEMRMEINATVEHYPTACSLKNLKQYIFLRKVLRWWPMLQSYCTDQMKWKRLSLPVHVFPSWPWKGLLQPMERYESRPAWVNAPCLLFIILLFGSGVNKRSIFIFSKNVSYHPHTHSDLSECTHTDRQCQDQPSQSLTQTRINLHSSTSTSLKQEKDVWVFGCLSALLSCVLHIFNHLFVV